MDAVLALMPEEERIQYSAMTGQSLFYMGETNLKHKILAICRRGRREPRGVCAEAAAKRRRADDREHGQGRGRRATWSRRNTASKVR